METKESRELRENTYNAVMDKLLKEGIGKEIADKTVENLDRFTKGVEYSKRE